MIILGVSDHHDAGAALLVDGRIVAAVEQERIDRVRHSRAFPSGAIDAVLDRAHVRARDVDRIAVGTTFTPSSMLRARPELSERVPGGVHDAWRAVQAGLRISGLYMVELDASRRVLERRFARLGFERATVEMVEHDLAHANVAYRTQPRDTCLVFTLDTPGDGAAITVSVARHLHLSRVHLQTSMAAIATLHRRVAGLLAVTEARLASLAAEGAPTPELRALFHGEVRLDRGHFNRAPILGQRDPLAARVRGLRAADVAAAAEDASGAVLREFVSSWIARTGIGDVALAGTLAEDPRLVGALVETPGLESLWVFPAAGDAGLALGAALAAGGTAVGPSPDLSLGPTYSDDDCYRQLSVARLPRDKVDDPDATTAALLAEGKVVCRFSGGVELGPRSLGHRAVFFDAHDVRARERAQRAMGRPVEQAPACVVPDHCFDADFPTWRIVADATRYAAVALSASPEFRARCAAVVQPDGTALPQRVGPRDALAPLLTAWARHGREVLGQASFNLHGQPVVCSPNDAVRAFRASKADALVLGPYLVTRDATPPA